MLRQTNVSENQAYALVHTELLLNNESILQKVIINTKSNKQKDSAADSFGWM